MIAIIVDDNIYRIMRSGNVEVAQIFVSAADNGKPDVRVLGSQWSQESPANLGMTGGEFEVVRQMLKSLAVYFPKGRHKLPVSEEKVVATAPADESTLGE